MNSVKIVLFKLKATKLLKHKKGPSIQDQIKIIKYQSILKHPNQVFQNKYHH